jgi:T-complex protein 1 subunit gamma
LLSESYITKQIHPTKIVSAFFMALEDSMNFMNNKLTKKIDLTDEKVLKNVVYNCIGKKFEKNHEKITQIAIDAVKTIKTEYEDKKEIDIKRFVKIEKIPGGKWEDSKVILGCVLNKDVLHSSMRRYIENPKILLLDCNLEYTKGESQITSEISEAEDFEKLLELEDAYVKEICGYIIKSKPDLVITEKGVSDLAQYYLQNAGISCLRRLKKTDNIRLALSTGAKIVSSCQEIKESDLGSCGVFEVTKIGDE